MAETMNWTECVIDASMGARDGLFTFCPIEGDIDGEFQVVTGMSFVGLPPRGMKMVAITHPDGQASVERFCKRHEQELGKLKAILNDYDPGAYDRIHTSFQKQPGRQHRS